MLYSYFINLINAIFDVYIKSYVEEFSKEEFSNNELKEIKNKIKEQKNKAQLNNKELLFTNMPKKLIENYNLILKNKESIKNYFIKQSIEEIKEKV